jgi:hypothetical protein
VKRKRTATVLALGLAALFVAGCQREEIEHYRVAREEKAQPGPRLEARGPMRLLGAIIVHEQKTWVFKLMGPAKDVGKYKEAFDDFIQSIRFPKQGDDPITWKVPEGWKEARAAGPADGGIQRYTTFNLNLTGHPLELTVFAFPGEAGSVLSNVVRWRRQIGLGPVGEEELAKITRNVKVDGVPATLVDMATPQSKPPDLGDNKAGVRMLVAIAPQDQRTWFFKLKGPAQVVGKNKAGFNQFIESIRFTGQEISWKLPEGWQEERGAGPRYATLRLGPKDKPLELTVFAFGPQAGSLLDNINRWRGQIGLGKITETDLDKVRREIKVQGARVTIVDMSSAGAGREEE